MTTLTLTPEQQKKVDTMGLEWFQETARMIGKTVIETIDLFQETVDDIFLDNIFSELFWEVK